ncbi:BspA family leucine-rich repeat surface protein [Eubacterium aggregans]|uniref:BspA family leucine-rich repeat surface protein n=1 Tax=Eubacterium aggregans TaxID=81409 RepID=UPI003F387FF6
MVADFTLFTEVFKDKSMITSIDLTSMDTSKVKNMAGMFYGCSGLSTLSVSGFNTSNVTSMAGMFNGCSRLSTLEMFSSSTEKVTWMSTMFKDCNGLKVLDLSGFNTNSVTRYGEMFKTQAETPLLIAIGANAQILKSYDFAGSNRIPFTGKVSVAEEDGKFLVDDKETQTLSLQSTCYAEASLDKGGVSFRRA